MTDTPRIIAIETSGRTGSVAIALGAQLLAERTLPATMRHAVELMPAIRDLTRNAGWSPDQIDHVYLSLGPGSFTGLRISVAIARSLHQAIGCQLIGIPSLDVIAENAPPTADIVLPILDAKRAQIFSARYQRNPAGALIQTAEAALVDPAAFLQEAITRAQQLHRPATIALLGEGLDYHRPALIPTLALPALPNITITALDPTHWPARATTVHRLGYARASQNAFSNPATLLPLYIRLPEAEEVYRKKHGIHG